MESFDYLEPGTIVADRYRVVSPLASGGFGAVYVAEQLATDRTVALKMLWPHLVHGAAERFAMEARIAGRLNSENIVQVLDAGVDAERRAPFLVMELLEGCDLEKLVEREGPLEPARVVEYLRQTAIGLDKAHHFVDRDGNPSPIVHRDLKPGNLFLSRREDGTEIVKILDFGIAKVLSGSQSLSGAIRGTPLYMAYEQAAQAPITAAVDVWSLGLIAFFLLTGKPYWMAAQDSEQVLTRLFAEVLTLPLERASVRARQLCATTALPPAFDAWFARAVNRDPRERMPSAGRAVRELALALGLEPLASSSASVPSPSLVGPMSGRASAVPPSGVLVTSDLAALGRTQGSAARSKRWWLLAPVAALIASLLAFVAFRDRVQAASGTAERASAQPSEALPPVASSVDVSAPSAELTDRPTVVPLVTASAPLSAAASAAPARSLAVAPRAVPASRPKTKPKASTVANPSTVVSEQPKRSDQKPPSIYDIR